MLQNNDEKNMKGGKEKLELNESMFFLTFYFNI